MSEKKNKAPKSPKEMFGARGFQREVFNRPREVGSPKRRFAPKGDSVYKCDFLKEITHIYTHICIYVKICKTLNVPEKIETHIVEHLLCGFRRGEKIIVWAISRKLKS